MTPRVLVLAGLDPSGRAGLLADAEAVRDARALPVACATAIAAQSRGRLVHLEPVGAGAIAGQIAAALEDGPLAAVKLGMLGTPAVLRAALVALKGPLAGVPVVADPVLSTSSGGSLYQGPPQDYLELLPFVHVLTPNLPEASLLTGAPVADPEQMLQAARWLGSRGPRAVLVKGGHLSGAPADLLWTAQDARWHRSDRVAAVGKRGTGCRLASALAAGLARGLELEEAVEAAIAYVRRYLLAPAG